MRACACTDTWTREGYNLGALGVVINMKTASSYCQVSLALPRTHASLAAHPATYRQTARGNEACSTCRMIACVLSMRRSMSMLLVSSTLFLPFPADQGYGDTRSTLAHRTVIQTALSAMLNQSTLGRTFTLLYVLALTLNRSENGKWK